MRMHAAHPHDVDESRPVRASNPHERDVRGLRSSRMQPAGGGAAYAVKKEICPTPTNRPLTTTPTYHVFGKEP